MVRNKKTDLARAIREFGPKTFKIEEIESGLTEEGLKEREKYWIEKLGTLAPNGLNVLSGGQISRGRGVKITYEDEEYPSIITLARQQAEEADLPVDLVYRYLLKGEPLPEKVRHVSDHPEAGGNLWRRWKSLLNGLSSGRRDGEIESRWLNYDNFADDVISGYSENLNLIRKDNTLPWGSDNFKWVTVQERVESVHGKQFLIDNVHYGSLAAVSRAFGINRTTLRYRIDNGMSIEEAVSVSEIKTSKKETLIDDIVFESINQAAQYASKKYGLSFDQARDRIRRGVDLKTR